MSLKLRLKPHEKLLIGHAVVRNGEKSAVLNIENDVPILREKDILKEEDAVTPGQRLYFIIQLMYVDNDDLPRYTQLFREQVLLMLSATPALETELELLVSSVEKRDYYNALKRARLLAQ